MNTNYDRVKENLEEVLRLKKSNGHSLTIIIFSHRLSGASLSEWYDFTNKWKDKGAEVVVGPLWNRAGYYGDKFDEMSVGLRNDKLHPCEKPTKQIAIEHDGNVVLCSLDYSHKVNIGNITKESIEDIWNGPVMSRYRESQYDPKKLKDLTLCNSCIRGGRYLLDEPTITRILNYNLPAETSKREYKKYLAVLDQF